METTSIYLFVWLLWLGTFLRFTPAVYISNLLLLKLCGIPLHEYCNFIYTFTCWWASWVVLVVKNPPDNAGHIRDMGRSLGWENPLEKEMAPHSSILAWRIPRTEEPELGLHMGL